MPAVDTGRFRPPAAARPDEPVRIFFYGRPWVARNAFALGLRSLRLVKERYGERVEILCAGGDWSPGQYGVGDVLDNLGMLDSLDEVAELYRSCHVGLVFMLTRHPSYQPLEFMASGAATVSNDNPHTGWLLRHEENALLAPPVPSLVAAQIGRLVDDRALHAAAFDRRAGPGRWRAVGGPARADLGSADEARRALHGRARARRRYRRSAIRGASWLNTHSPRPPTARPIASGTSAQPAPPMASTRPGRVWVDDPVPGLLEQRRQRVEQVGRAPVLGHRLDRVEHRRSVEQRGGDHRPDRGHVAVAHVEGRTRASRHRP